MTFVTVADELSILLEWIGGKRDGGQGENPLPHQVDPASCQGAGPVKSPGREVKPRRMIMEMNSDLAGQPKPEGSLVEGRGMDPDPC